MNRLAPVFFAIAVSLAALVSPPAAAASDPLAECQQAYEAGDLAASRAAAETVLGIEPDSYAASWMLARVLIDQGNRAPDKPAREPYYREAERHARRAIALNPDDTWGHHYLAASIGKLALSAGGKTKINMSKEVRDEAARAIALDPRNDKSLHILGRWNREIANLSPLLKLAAKVVYGGVPKGASNEKAVEYFQRALAVNPTHVNHHFELGVTYHEMGRYDLAVASFEQALALPARDPNDPQYHADAERWLEKARARAAAPRRDVSR